MTPDSTVDGALRLRSWALHLMGAAAAPPPLPPASPAAWDLFLRVERVAIPLAEALGARAPGDAHAAVLRAARMAELQRVLSARATLHQLRGIARERGLTVAVMKGAVAVLRRGAPDLSDVDVYASAPEAAVLAEEIDRMGYRAVGAPGAHALRLRAAADSLPVEVHTSIPGTHGAPERRLGPAPALPGLCVLHPADHLWYVLHHATEQHAERRGALRDLLVLADALDACGAEDRREVERWIAGHWRPELPRRMLEMAEGLRRREGAPADPFRLDAAGRYVGARWMARAPAKETLLVVLGRAITSGVARRGGFPCDQGSATLDLPSGYPFLAWMRRRVPRAERWARLAIRRGPEWALYPLGAAAARAAARAVRRAG
jgi:hypothetical protein